MNQSTQLMTPQSLHEFQRIHRPIAIWNRLSQLKYDTDAMLEQLLNYFSMVQPSANEFPLIVKSYSRNLLFRDSSGFEVVAIRWDAGAITPIHGHPGFSLIYLIEGELNEKSYQYDQNRLLRTANIDYGAGDYSYHIGEFGRFDNAIHRIAAKTRSLSLHIYSDDAVKGERFNIY